MREMGTEGHDGEAGGGVRRHMAVVKKSERDGNLWKSAGGLKESVRE